MVALWSVLGALLCSVHFGAALSSLEDDDPVVKKINEVITNANNYLTDHLLTSLSLPNIGVLPLDPVKLTEGKVSQFDTIQLTGTPLVNQKKNQDGSTTYTFDLNLSLDVLLVQYQFRASFLGLYSQEGQLTISPQDNALALQGIVVVGPGSECDAVISSAEVVHLDKFQIDIQPTDIPFISKISETILNVISPKLQWILDVVVKAAIFSPSCQRNFSDLVCSAIKSK
ncbi:unnamed protein product [Nezara viridula]|uniref:Uncharacterized protein n=1 Tax=Nezara viridula TaxID=85310 RepID=A0A9P0E5V6_NEZVI|nr:unnamed protein product [Nezara viridula]